LLGGRRLGGEEHEVEIAKGSHLAATGTAKTDESEAVGRVIEEAFGHEVVGKSNELVMKECRRLRRGSAVSRFAGEAASDFLASGSKRPGKDCNCVDGHFLARSQPLQTVGDLAPIDDRALVVDDRKGHGERSEASLLRR
jgi:hypothetical protein